ncbi:MAG: DUF1667 domain-containing protein [Candidatus Omnitrophota bacterium]
MTKTITCIECPVGCSLSVDIENCKVVKVAGNQCPKGAPYAVSEIENPMRILTSSVLAEGMDLKMIPVRTDKPIPKNYTFKAMDEIKKIKVTRPVGAGSVIAADFLGLGVNLVATRGSY